MKKDSQIVKESFFKAHLDRPHRAEPLYALLEQFKQSGDYEKGYEFSKCSLELPLRSLDVLFVEKWMCDFGLLMQYAFFALQTGRYSEGITACDQLLMREDLSLDRRSTITHYQKK